jgi:hypothetical protein
MCSVAEQLAAFFNTPFLSKCRKLLTLYTTHTYYTNTHTHTTHTKYTHINIPHTHIHIPNTLHTHKHTTQTLHTHTSHTHTHNIHTHTTHTYHTHIPHISDHNYLQYKIRKGGACIQNNSNTSKGTRFNTKEEKLHVFDWNIVQEMWNS